MSLFARPVPPLLLAASLLAAGCEPPKDADDAPPSDTSGPAGEADDDSDAEGTDGDGDGWPPEAGDCDDRDASVHPEAEDAEVDGTDQDCDGLDGPDADADGHVDAAAGGDDCDDGDAGVSPSAYDRPNDGIDQDCTDGDRLLDGIVLPEGDALTDSRSLGVSATGVALDVGVVVGSTNTMEPTLLALDFHAIDAALPTTTGDVRYGIATYDDYPCCGFANSSSGDTTFTLHQQITDDVAAVNTAVSLPPPSHHGGDGPASGMEALYQALTGHGHDLSCDGTFDADFDVLPFVAHSTDPFGGAVSGTYDPSTSGGGELGGMGFRDGAIPIVILATDYDLRDPSSGYPTGGGCPQDSGSTEVAEAAQDLGAWLVGLHIGAVTTTPTEQLTDLSHELGHYADTDSDGLYDDILVYPLHATDVSATIAEAVGRVEDAELNRVYASVWLAAVDDSDGLVDSIHPAEYTSVSRTDLPLEFTIDWAGNLPATTDAQTRTVSFALYADGRELETFQVVVEVPPL